MSKLNVQEEVTCTMRGDLRSVAYLGVTGVLFGWLFVLIKVVGEGVPPVALATGRAALTGFALYLFLRSQGDDMPRFGKAWGHFFLLGIAGFLAPISLIAFAETEIASGLTAVLFTTQPIMTILLGSVLVDEVLSTGRVLGVLVGFIGVCVVLLPSLLAGSDFTLVGILAALAGSLLAALSAIYVRRYLRNMPAAKTVIGMTSCAALIGLLVVIIAENPMRIRPNAEEIVAWILLSLVCSAVGWLLYVTLIAERGPAFATLALFIQSPVAIVVSGLLLGTSTGWTTLAGMVLILLSVAMVDGYLDPLFLERKQASEPLTLSEEEVEIDDDI